VGGVIELRKTQNQDADSLLIGGRHHGCIAISRASRRSCVVLEPAHAEKQHAREPGDLWSASARKGTRPVCEGPKPQGRRARSGGVGPHHSIDEPDEQRSCVFDLYIEARRQKVATGDAIVVRYADDLVVGFENRTEAERFLEAFRDRLAKFGLQLHPEKTRLIEFGRFAAQDREKRGEGKPETFTFLGFTHYCGKRRSNGAFTVWRKTAKKRMVANLQAIKAELRRRMHEPIADVGAWLRKVVTGYYRYHAIPGNIDRLSVFGQRLRRLWWLILRRRSQRRASWDRVARVFPQWIPAPRVLHPYPTVRFLATHPRWEPYA